MKRMLLFVATLAATAPAMGQTSNAEKGLTALAMEADAAFARNDAAFFDRVLADEWTFIAPDGTTLTKTQWLKAMKDGTFKVESAETLERKVRIHGDAGVDTYRRRVKFAGQPMNTTVAITSVLIKRDGKWLCIASQVTQVAAASEGEDGVKADWAKVRGKWEQKDKEGRTIRTKEVRGNQETVTYFDDKGKVVYAHTVEVKLERVGNVRLFTFSKEKVVAGPDKSQEFAGPFSYIYTTDGQTFVEVMGFLVGQEEPLAKDAPQVATWKRVKE